MGKRERSKARDLAVALRHPLRRRLLSLVLDAKQASTRQLADAAGRPLSNVGYHLNVLAGCGALAPVQADGGDAPTDLYRCVIDPVRARRALDTAAAERPQNPPAGEIPGGREP